MSKKKRKVVFKKGEVDIKPLNLLNMERVVQLNTQFLERVFDDFSRELGRTFYRQFKRNLTTSMVSQNVLEIGEFLKSFESSTFKINKEIERGFINFENQLTFEMLTLGYGGRESHPKESLIKELTQVELRFMEGVVEKILIGLGHSFSIFCPVEFLWEKNETNPNFFALSKELVIVFTFEVHFEVKTGEFNIALPYSFVEKLRRRF